MRVPPTVGVGLLLTVNAAVSAETVVWTDGQFAAGPSALSNGSFNGTWTFEADMPFPPDEEIPGLAILNLYDQNGGPVFTTADFGGVQAVAVRFTPTGIRFGERHRSMSDENVLWFGLEFAALEGLGFEFLNGSVMYLAEDSLAVTSATAFVIPEPANGLLLIVGGASLLVCSRRRPVAGSKPFSAAHRRSPNISFFLIARK